MSRDINFILSLTRNEEALPLSWHSRSLLRAKKAESKQTNVPFFPGLTLQLSPYAKSHHGHLDRTILSRGHVVTMGCSLHPSSRVVPSVFAR